MAESYIEMFEETYYPPAFKKMALHTIRDFDEHQEEITENFKNMLDRHMDQLCSRQNLKTSGMVEEITLSFLYTSLEQECAEFRIDSYGEGGRLYGEELLSERFFTPWLTVYLDELTDALKVCAEENSLRRYIRSAELEKLKLRAVRSLLYYFSSRFRYVMADALDRKRLAALQKTDTFVIAMGEYQDWQKPVFALMPEVDIFNCGEQTMLDFRRFAAVYYKDKDFEGKRITNSRFTDCTFEDCRMEGCQLNDSIFDGCVFKNVEWKETEMIGCLFIDCEFQNVRFEKIAFDADTSQKTEEYYEPAEFYRCGFSDTAMENCLCSRCVVKDCDIENLVITASVAEKSDFLEDARIIWGEDKREVPQDGIF